MTGVEAILVSGSLHGVILATVLRRRVRNRRANSYLAALLGALSLLLFDGFLRAGGALVAHPHLIGLTAWVPFVLGPLVYLYVREMTEPDPTRIGSPWRHFIVTGVYLVLLIVTFYPRSASYKLSVAQHDASWIITATEVALLVYGIGYAIAALMRLRHHRDHVEERFSNLRGVSLRWLVVLAVLNALVWIVALVAFVLRMSGTSDSTALSLIVPVGSTITIFVIGYFHLWQAEIYDAQPVAAPRELAAPVATEVAEEPAKPIAYQRARLAEDDAAELEARIMAAMIDTRLYQRAGLTLAELADAVAATPHEVSQVLSTRLKRNFYTFINEHRIEHVKTGLLSGDRPVLDLAFEAGFQSKSTFNTAFRKATGTTPREYRQRAIA